MKHFKTHQMSQQRFTFVESQTNLHKLPEQVRMLLNLLLKSFVQLEHLPLCEDRGNHALKQFKIVSLSMLGFSLYEKYLVHLFQLQTVVPVCHEEELCSIGWVHLLFAQSSLANSNLE